MNTNALQLSLLLMRLTVFLVMFVWTVDKFVNPGHAASIYENFYFIPGLGSGIIYVIGAVELVILAAFLLGIAKFYSYGLIMLLHGVSTLSSFKQYLAPFDGANLLFFAAWPMLAACIALFLLRDQDRMFIVGR